jgi:uncharacterized protein
VRVGRRSGSADLPLHGGRVPAWLGERMSRLGRVIVEALILEYGKGEVLRRLAHPFWFQSLGCVMGMDWHSSGITTSVVGALKRGLAPIEKEIGIHVCGGRGRHSRKTPEELIAVGERTGLNGNALAQTSRLVAKVDNAAVQDGFQLYLHAFIVTDSGEWTVVQQGMDPERGHARRYHWLSEGLESFVDEPHAAIEGEGRGEIINLTDRRAALARTREVEIARSGPDEAVRLLVEASRAPHLIMPDHHEVRPNDVVPRRLHAALAVAEQNGVSTFEELLLTPGVGPRTIASLALVSEVIYGAPSRFTDPARFAFAHGGKDGHPFPVPLKVYDQTLRVLRDAVDRAKLGREDRLSALRNLDQQARLLEGAVEGKPVEQIIAEENEVSEELGGMSVFGPAQPKLKAAAPKTAGPTSGKAPKKPAAQPKRGQLELPFASGQSRR